MSALSLFVAIGLSSCVRAEVPKHPVKAEVADASEYDLILDGVPRHVQWIETGSFANAVEQANSLEDLDVIVAFRVVHVVKEDQPEENKLANLNVNRIVTSVSKLKWNDLLKRRKMDGGGDITKRWFRIAVKDPEAAFGITSWDPPERVTHRIYLKRHEEMKETYWMVKSERL